MMPARTIKSILVANRGEPVRRAIATCKRLGIAVCGVFIDEDRSTDWIAECDLSVRIGSYLCADDIINAAKRVKIDAIWPAWGFLSESSEFAKKVIESGIVWIGPSPSSMELLSHKGNASKAAKDADLTTIPEIIVSPSVIGDQFSVKGLLRGQAFPLLVKPALGGGGQGQVVISCEDDILPKLEEAGRVNASQFGGGDLVVQKLITEARHIEFQMLADGHGNVTVLGERDCSIQRRNQKVIEESPSPAISKTLRDLTVENIIKFAKNVGYSSAGTIEFLYSEGKLYFLEVNTRLQVEHPVTELTTLVNGDRIDILEQMIDVAGGGRLAFSQRDIVRKGHAVEARIYAEDVKSDFRPSPGELRYIKFPHSGRIRVDSAFSGATGTVSSKFDPMIAKVIAFAPDRVGAIGELKRTLHDTAILGLPTNVAFCERILSSGDFVSGEYSTRFIRDNLVSLVEPGPFIWTMMAAVMAARYQRDGKKECAVRYEGAEVLGKVLCVGEGRYITFLNDHPVDVGLEHVSGHRFILRTGEGSFSSHIYLNGSFSHIVAGGEDAFFEITHDDGDLDANADVHGAPTGGRIAAIKVSPGDAVRKGDVLFVIEAMKMETSVKAHFEGTVRSVLLDAGDVVESGDKVVDLETSMAGEGAPDSSPKKMIGAAFPKISSLARFIKEPLSQSSVMRTSEHLGLIRNYFAGYDVPVDCVKMSGRLLGDAPKSELVELLSSAMGVLTDIGEVFSEEHASSVQYFLSNLAEKDRKLPKQTLRLLERIFASAYSCDLKDINKLLRVVPYFENIYRHNFEMKKEIAFELVSYLALEDGVVSKGLLDPLVRFAGSGIVKSDTALHSRSCELLERLDKASYHRIVPPPVAEEYLGEYERFVSGQPDRAEGEPVNGSLPSPVNAWFAGFEALTLPVTDTARSSGVSVHKVGKRLVAVAMPERAVPVKNGNGIVSIPELERASIEAYKSIKAYAESGNGPNHVFVIVPDSFVLPWSADDKNFSLSLSAVKKISKRVAGFAHGLSISATEIIIKLRDEKGDEISSILEVRHAGTVGLISRPPYPVSEREAENDKDQERILNDKQQRLGKLLNKDRARLLFDDGAFEELPDIMFGISGQVKTGLDVYKGRINGNEALCYAGDYRIQGGALGENEGKKLAASVVLAYCMGVPLIGIHDGAGANIKGSVASLGWAGAYFGAIANTGGFSNHEKFLKWLNGHHEHAYFGQVLDNFNLRAHALTRSRTSLKHIHLNLGAAVGMLVYGSSISNLSIMADHPEIYRVLTGAATVQKVLGEKATNYELGGAIAHARKSGDIDFVLPTEEAAIRHARDMLRLISSKGGGEIERDHSFPQPVLPVKGSVIFGRDAALANVDSGTFFETRRDMEDSGAVMTGFACLGGKPVVMAAMATDNGISSERAFKKVSLAFSSAQEFGLPMIVVMGSRFARLDENADARAIYQYREMLRLYEGLKGVRINIILGHEGLLDGINAGSDIIFSVKRGCESERRDRAANALSHMVVGSVGEAFDRVNGLMNTISSCSGTIGAGSLGTVTDAKALVPDDLAMAYDMRGVILAAVDQGTFVELFQNDGQPLITGIARLGGSAVGVIADDPMVLGGAQNIHSISKFTRFNRLCEKLDIPVVQLNDSTAFTPGSQQEHAGIQGEGGRSIREECLSENLKIAVTLRQNYGGRLIHANLKTLGSPRMGLVCDNAKVGVMGAKGAVGVLHGKKLALIGDRKGREKEELRLVKEYESEKLSPDRMVELGYAEKKVPLNGLREELAKMIAAKLQYQRN